MSRFGFGTKEEILAQLEAFKLMERWEEEHPMRFTPEEALALADELYDLLSPDARRRHDDARREGARWMMAVLARLR